MIKKILLLLPLLFLGGCFWSDSDKASVDYSKNLEMYDSKDFYIFIPSAWQIIKDESNILPKPAHGNVALAVNSTQYVGGFLNNLLVLQEEIDFDISSSDYSTSNNAGSRNDYKSYYLLEEKDITFENDDKSRLFIFEARYNKDTPVLNFMQTAIVCKSGSEGSKDKAYLLTIALSKEIKDFARYETIFKSFNCK